MSQNLWKRVLRNGADIKSTRCVLMFAVSSVVTVLLLSPAIATAAPQNAAGNADNGKQLFTSVGCAGCHGPLAKGMTGLGPQITPPPFPLPDFVSFVRHPAGAMRPFSKDDVSDTQLGDIYAYLKSLSPGSDTPTANLTGNAENGKRLFLRDGCYECHGILGQGANGYAPRIAPDPISLQAIMNYIRKPAGNMPPYTAKIVPDQDVADIYAYLRSVPRPTELKNVPTFSK